MGGTLHQSRLLLSRLFQSLHSDQLINKKRTTLLTLDYCIMHIVKPVIIRRSLVIFVALYAALLAFHVDAQDILINAPYGETTSLTITANTLNINTGNSAGFKACINGTCSLKFYTFKTANRVLSNENYTANEASISYAPSNATITGDTLSVPYEACTVNQTDFCNTHYTGNIIFTITNAPNLNFASRNSADSTFELEICQGNDQPSYCDDFDNLSIDEKQKALESINPEEVSAGYTETLSLANEQSGNMSQRFSELRSGTNGMSVAGLTYTLDGESLSGQWLHAIADSIGGGASADDVSLISNWGAFINGSITRGEYDGSNLERRYDNSGNSITAGVDYRFNRGLIGGIAYGVSQSSLEFEGNNDAVDSDMSNILLYATWFKNTFSVDVVIGTIKGDIKTSREITLTNTIAIGNADTKQDLWSIAGSYEFSNGALTYGPYSRYDQVKGHIDAYHETNGGGLEVGFEKQKIRSQVLTIGGHLSYVYNTSWVVAIPYSRVEWKREYEDRGSTVNGHFVSTTNNEEFEINVDGLDARWFQAAIGISFTFPHGFSTYVDYDHMLEYNRTRQKSFSYGGRWEMPF